MKVIFDHGDLEDKQETRKQAGSVTNERDKKLAGWLANCTHPAEAVQSQVRSPEPSGVPSPPHTNAQSGSLSGAEVQFGLRRLVKKRQHKVQIKVAYVFLQP